jgi:hypothetical protein
MRQAPRITAADAKELAVRKAITRTLIESGLPSHEHPPILADCLLFTTLAIGRPAGLSFSAMQAILHRLRRGLDDFTYRRLPFEKTGPTKGEAADLSLVVADGIEQFIRLWFSSLDAGFRRRILRGKDEDVAAQELLRSMCREVCGERDCDASFTAVDLGELLDRVSWLVLATRYPDVFQAQAKPWEVEL